jgi:hypothetical protein
LAAVVPVNARDLPYDVLYLEEDFPEDMRGVTADLTGNDGSPYLLGVALFTIDHLLAPGFAGRLLGFKRISGDLVLEAGFDCGTALLIWSSNSWIIAPQSRLRGRPRSA